MRAERSAKERGRLPRVSAGVRCAIYTRKSTDEGLDQTFNTLDAQREAGESFIKSQRQEGWTALPQKYDDGGYTGANMDRPALKRLLADVESGAGNCIVVYKVDRLSRSLLDFARIMEILDKHGATFVSVEVTRAERTLCSCEDQPMQNPADTVSTVHSSRRIPVVDAESHSLAVNRLSNLSAPWQALVRLCQSIDYGQICGLHIRNGEPAFNPAPQVLREIKLDGECNGRPEAALEDFMLRDEVRRLIQELDQFGNGCLATTML